MLNKVALAARLALQDWLHERTLSLCAVLALASMLAPLLVLQGVKNGVVGIMRERLLQDPEVLIITPAGSGSEGSYTAEFIASLIRLPGARFVIGRTRDIATDLGLQGPSGGKSVQMEPCAPGEPLLEHYQVAPPRDGAEPELVLSARAAQALGVRVGGRVTANLGRRTPEGRLESTTLRFHVSAVLPEQVSGRNLGLLPLQVLEDIQDYRDYIEVPRRAAQGFSGRPRPAGERRYSSFRLYAQDLDAVESLASALSAQGIEARTRAREIAGIRRLAAAITSVILIISLAVGTGFAAFTLSSVQGAVRRKDRMLGMLRLLGFPRAALLLFPLSQALLTAVSGIMASGCLYLPVSYGIDRLFAVQSGNAALCRLSPAEMLAATGIVVLLAILAAARASWQAASIEPSAVIREI